MEKVYTNFENVKFQEPLDVRPLVVRTLGCKNLSMEEPLIVRPLVVRTPGCKKPWL